MASSVLFIKDYSLATLAAFLLDKQNGFRPLRATTGGCDFDIPGTWVKNSDDRLVVLNDQAKAVIEEVRGIDPVYVFTYRNKPLHHMLNSAWKKARRKVGLPRVRVHDLKHTFGRRLRSAGISYEFRLDLLGHRSSRITTHYCAGEVGDLLTAANKACHLARRRSTPILSGLGRENVASALSVQAPA